MFAEELRGCPQLATVHTHFFRAEWLSQGSAVRTSKMATASSLDVSAPTCFSFGEDRLGTILSASTPGSVESTRELFKDLLSPSASTLMSTRLQAFSQGALRFCWVASYLSCSYFMVTINPTTRTKRDGDKRFRKTCVRERFKESHVVFGLPPSSHFVVCLCVRAFVCPRGRSHFNMFHDAECRFNVPLGFGKACSAALSPNLMEWVVQYGPAVELWATEQLSGLTERFVLSSSLLEALTLPAQNLESSVS